MMLNTIEFGWIRIRNTRPSWMFDTLLEVDLGGDWEFWNVDGEVVAYYIGD